MSKPHNWTLQEDKLLVELHQQAGCFQRWKYISKKLKEKGIQKSQFQCRERFTNHADPSLKQGKLSRQEIAKLFSCYDEYGPRWSFFETKMPGRPQSLLKNKFYSTLRSMVRHFIKVGQKRNLNLWKIQSSNISSKILTDLYQGRKKFLICKNFLKNMLKSVNYSLQGQKFQQQFWNVSNIQLQNMFKAIHENKEERQENQLNPRNLVENNQLAIINQTIRQNDLGQKQSQIQTNERKYEGIWARQPIVQICKGNFLPAFVNNYELVPQQAGWTLWPAQNLFSFCFYTI